MKKTRPDDTKTNAVSPAFIKEGLLELIEKYINKLNQIK